MATKKWIKVMALTLPLIMALMALPLTGLAADKITVQGEVVKGEGGDLFLETDDATYKLAGQDLSGQVGQELKVTGTESEGDGETKILTVTEFEEAN